MILKNKGRIKKSILTTEGEISYTRTCLAPADKESAANLLQLENRKCIFPLDSMLEVDMQPLEMTEELIVELAKVGIQSKSYNDAAERAEKLFFSSFNDLDVKRATDLVGYIVFSYIKQQSKETYVSFSKSDIEGIPKVRRRLYITCDGTMINTRTVNNGTSYRECKIASTFDADDIKERIGKNGEIYHKILNRRIVSYIGEVEYFKKLFLHLLYSSEAFSYDEVIMLSGGAKWIHNLMDEYFNNYIHVIDLYHVKENTAEFGKYVNREHPENYDSWPENMYTMLDNGDIDTLLDSISEYADVELPKGVPNLYNYINERRFGMNYKWFKENGIFVGSGTAESTNKFAAKDRLDLVGMRWNIETGNGVVILKAMLEADQWEEVERIVHCYYRNLTRYYTLDEIYEIIHSGDYLKI